MTSLADADLCARAQRGDAYALSLLVGRYGARVRAWALYEVGRFELAEEAVQESWIRFETSLDRFDPGRPLGPWLRTVVRRTCRDLQRSERRHLAEPLPVVGRASRLDEALDVQRGAQRMVDAFGDLSPRQREALDLVDRQGLSAVVAAEQMGISASTVRVLCHQARGALRAHIFALELREVVRQ